MFAKGAIGAASLILLGACAASAPPRAVPGSGGQQLATACQGRDGWSDPAPPAHMVGNVHYVGTCGITALLITSRAGHILIDGATAEAAPHIVANIRQLGFEPRDVRYILTSHEHIDHVGGIAALKQLTGAKLLARAEARPVLETGRTEASDPQAGAIPDFAGARVDRTIADGETLRLGPIAVTARATPGHTSGSTSWTWRDCEGRDCRSVVYADSLTAVSREGYRFSDHPELIARFRSTFDRVAALDCDILITPHPSASNLFGRLAGQAPLADRGACAAYAAGAKRRLDDRLAREAPSK